MERCPRCSNLTLLDPRDRIGYCLCCGWYEYSSMRIINSKGEVTYIPGDNYEIIRPLPKRKEDNEIRIISQLRRTPQRDKVLLELRS